jgi:hypothetical protein
MSVDTSGDWSFELSDGTTGSTADPGFNDLLTANDTDSMSAEAVAREDALSAQLNRPLTPNEILTVIDLVRQSHGLRSSYSAPLPGITTAFLAAADAFTANVIQRASPWQDNSIAQWFATDANNGLASYGVGTVHDVYDSGGSNTHADGSSATSGAGVVDYNPKDNLASTAKDASNGVASAASAVIDTASKTLGQILSGILDGLSFQTIVLIGGGIFVYVYLRKKGLA